MSLELATLDDIADELGKRGLHGVLAVDDLHMVDQTGDCGGGVYVIGHPSIGITMARVAGEKCKEGEAEIWGD